MATAAKISIAIEAQTATLQRGFDEAKSAIKQLDAGMSSHVASGMAKFQAGWIAIQGAIGAARGAFSSFLSTVDSMSAEQDWADRLGIGADELAALGYAAEQTGASQDVLRASLQKMQNNLSEASQEAGVAVKALQELGLSAQRLRELTPDRQFVAISEAMTKVGNQGDRTRLTLDIFGKSGGELNNLLREGAKGLEGYGREAEQLGLKMGDARKYVEEFGDSLHKLEVGWQATKNNIAAGWALVLEEPTNFLTKTIRYLRDELTHTEFGKAVGSTQYLAKKAAREVEQQLKATQKTAEKAAEKIKETWKDIPKPQDYATPSIGAVTKGTAAGFSAVQESQRKAADDRRWQDKMLVYQQQVIAAIKANKIQVATVNI